MIYRDSGFPPRRSAPAWLLLGLLTLAGCGGTPAKPEGSSATAGAPAEAAAGPFVLGDMIEPFTPPTLEDLLADGEWTDGVVDSGARRLREEQADAGDPPLTVEEALALRPDSPEANDKLVATLGRLAPESGEGVDKNAKLVRHCNGDLNSTNPVLMSTNTDQDYNGLTSAGLMTFDRHFDPFAHEDFVRSWRRSGDGLVDIIELRDDLTWSDGKPITAHDIVFTYRVILSSQVPIPALRTDMDKVRWVEAYDDHTVAFFHKEALATNSGAMNFPWIPKHIYEGTIADDPTLARSDRHRELENNPVTGGAYELKNRVRGQEFVLKRRESFYLHDGEPVRDKPHFAEVRFKNIEDSNTALLALKSGRIDEMMILPDQWMSQTDDDAFYKHNTKASGESWTTYYIVWNQKTPLFEDQRVRHAMSLAIDYEEMLNRIFFGVFQPSSGTYHPNSWMHPKDGPTPMRRDLDRAEDLLDEAGWTDSDGDGVRDKMVKGRKIKFRFTLMCHQYPILVRLNTLIKENLEQLGVECLLKPTEFTVAVEKTRGKEFQAYQGVWGTGADPSTSENIFMTGEGRNYGSYSNPEVDRLFVEARRELDRDRRAELYGEIHKLLWEDQPFTWLLYRNAFYGFNKELRGYNFSPRGPYLFAPGLGSIYQAKAL